MSKRGEMKNKVLAVFLIMTGLLITSVGAHGENLLPCDVEVNVGAHKTWDYTGVATKIQIAFKNESDEKIRTASFAVIDNKGMVITVAYSWNAMLKPGEGKVLQIQKQYTQFPKPSNLWEEKMRSEENKYKDLAGCRLIGVTYKD